jgi:hypothetical protein
MDYTLRLPNRPSVTLKGWGNLPVELLAAAAGVKAVTHAWVDPADEGYFQELKAGLGLEHFVYTRTKNGAQERLGVMIGRDPGLLKECARVWEAPRANPGVNLGYPECCSDFYCKWLNATLGDDPLRTDIIRIVARNTPPGAPYSFLLNDVFYMYSRRWAETDAAKREKICALNRGLDMNCLNVVPYHSCSYACPNSLEKARKIWTLMALIPPLAAQIKSCLAKPVLFWDWDRFAVLKGTLTEDGGTYEAVQPPYSLLEEGPMAALRAGDALKRGKGGALEVWKGRKKVAVLDGDPLVLPFTS